MAIAKIGLSIYQMAGACPGPALSSVQVVLVHSQTDSWSTDPGPQAQLSKLQGFSPHDPCLGPGSAVVSSIAVPDVLFSDLGPPARPEGPGWEMVASAWGNGHGARWCLHRHRQRGSWLSTVFAQAQESLASQFTVLFLHC